MSTVLRQLIESGWYGSINEVGIGLPLLSAITLEDGASGFLFEGRSTYSQKARLIESYQLGHHRLVSEDLVIEESKRLCQDLVDKNVKPPQRLFGYSISGTHKNATERGETHFWAAITYVSGWDRNGKPSFSTDTFHAWVPKKYNLDRAAAAKYCFEAHMWFLEGALLKKKLEYPLYPLQSPLFIDVINSSKMSLEDSISLIDGPLLGMFKPGVYGEPVMIRPQDYLRAPDPVYNSNAHMDPGVIVYRGSFDPVHYGHAQIADAGRGVHGFPPVVFEICLESFWGKDVSIDSVAHRIRMLTRQGYEVIVSRDPRFNDLTNTLKHYGVKKTTYIVGADVFNAILNNSSFRPEDVNAMGPDSGVQFKVCEARTPINVPDAAKQLVSYSVWQPRSQGNEVDLKKYSSTLFRETKDLSMVPPRVAAYIKENHLYGF